MLYERELVQVPRGIPSMHRDTFVARKLRAATLTRLGTELLINDPANNQIIVVDTKALAESQISLASIDWFRVVRMHEAGMRISGVAGMSLWTL